MLHCVALFIFASAAFCLYAKCVLTGAFCLTVVLLYCSRYCWFSWSWKCVRHLESYTDFFRGKIKVYHIVSYHFVSCCIISCAILLYHIVLSRAMLYPLESYWRNAWPAWVLSLSGNKKSKACAIFLKRLCLMTGPEMWLSESGALKSWRLPLMTAACISRWGERRPGSGRAWRVALKWT